MRPCPCVRVSPTPPKPPHVAGVVDVALWPPRATHRGRLSSVLGAVESVDTMPKNETTRNTPPQRFRAHPVTVAVTPHGHPERRKRLPPPLRPPNRHRGRPNHAGRRARLPPPARMQHAVAGGPAASACRECWPFHPFRVQWYHKKHKYHTGRHRKAGFVSKVC